MKEKQQKAYISGLKGMGCVLIMVGHFLGIYKYAQVFPGIRFIDILQNSSLSLLTNEGYWLYLFFVISGYLVAKSKINNVRELLTKSIHRFLRFAISILFSFFVIYVLYLVFGFHNQETIPLFQCGWFQKYYTDSYSIMDVISLYYGRNFWPGKSTDIGR